MADSNKCLVKYHSKNKQNVHRFAPFPNSLHQCFQSSREERDRATRRDQSRLVFLIIQFCDDCPLARLWRIRVRGASSITRLKGKPLSIRSANICRPPSISLSPFLVLSSIFGAVTFRDTVEYESGSGVRIAFILQNKYSCILCLYIVKLFVPFLHFYIPLPLKFCLYLFHKMKAYRIFLMFKSSTKIYELTPLTYISLHLVPQQKGL